MKHTISEPPGRRLVSKTASPKTVRSNVLPLPKASTISDIRTHFEIPADSLPVHAYASVEHMVHELRPEMPVYCLRPATIAATAKRFLKSFPGDVLYAVKTNPDRRVLRTLVRAGIRHFDVASLAEVKQVAGVLPDAHMYFMHPVKSREAIKAAYFEYGVRDFSLDSLDELAKIMETTGYADDLNLYIRLSIPNEAAAYSLSGKFGVQLEQAATLLLATRKVASKLGVCFHVGSQCMNPDAYIRAMQLVSDLLMQSGVRIDILDIGGGFPSIYPGMVPPPLGQYMKAIKKGMKACPIFSQCKIVCEPGRALVAEGGSTVARVELRKGNMLYLNEGTFGSFFDAGGAIGFNFPVKAMRPEGTLSQNLAEFGFFGPTCDSMDVMKGPFYLPEDIGEGDFIEVGQLGSYGMTMRTNFNGFQSDTVVEVGDQPLLSMLGVN